MAAAGTACLAFAMDLHERAILLMQRVFARRMLTLDGCDCCGQYFPHRIVQLVALLFTQRRRAPQRAKLCFKQDLIRVCIADPREESLIAQNVLELTAMASQARSKGSKIQCGVERVRPQLAECRYLAGGIACEIDARHHCIVEKADILCTGELKREAGCRQGRGGSAAIGKPPAEHGIHDKLRPRVFEAKYEEFPAPVYALDRPPRQVAGEVQRRIADNKRPRWIGQNGEDFLTGSVLRQRIAQ